MASIAQIKSKGTWSSWADWHSRFDQYLRAAITAMTTYALVAFALHLEYFDRIDLRVHHWLLQTIGASAARTLSSATLNATNQGSAARYGTFVLVATLLACVYFITRNRVRSATLLLIAVGGSFAVQAGLNNVVADETSGYEAGWLNGHQFPSVYATAGVTLYLALAFLLARTVPRSGGKVIMGVGAVVAASTVASTLTVDLPSQTLAGCLIAITWLSLLAPIAMMVLAVEDMRRKPRLLKKFSPTVARPSVPVSLTRAIRRVRLNFTFARTSEDASNPRSRDSEGLDINALLEPPMSPKRPATIRAGSLGMFITETARTAIGIPKGRLLAASSALQERHTIRTEKAAASSEERRVKREAAAEEAAKRRLEREASEAVRREQAAKEAEERAAEKSRAQEAATPKTRARTKRESAAKAEAEKRAHKEQAAKAAEEKRERERTKREAAAKAEAEKRAQKEEAAKAAEEKREREHAKREAAAKADAEKRAQREEAAKAAEEKRERERAKREAAAKADAEKRAQREEAAKVAEEKREREAAIKVAEESRRRREAEEKQAAKDRAKQDAEAAAAEKARLKVEEQARAEEDKQQAKARATAAKLEKQEAKERAAEEKRQREEAAKQAKISADAAKQEEREAKERARRREEAAKQTKAGAIAEPPAVSRTAAETSPAQASDSSAQPALASAVGKSAPEKSVAKGRGFRLASFGRKVEAQSEEEIQEINDRLNRFAQRRKIGEKKDIGQTPPPG